MTDQAAPEFFIWTLYAQLRRRQFPLGPEDYQAVRLAMQAGYGWESPDALRDLCCLLWAKSRRERNILCALFAQYEQPRLALAGLGTTLPERRQGGESVGEEAGEDAPPIHEPALPFPPLVTERYGGFPPLAPGAIILPRRPFIFEAQFPVSFREVAQIWRWLRSPLRIGPPTELDIAATVLQRSRRGIGTPPVLVPRRRNRERLLLLCDRRGSMSGFHDFCTHVCEAIVQAGRLEHVEQFYFHDVPITGGDRTALNRLIGQMFPTLDSVLNEIAPCQTGWLFSDPELTVPQATQDVLQKQAAGTAVVVLSDGGAARGQYDVARLLDTVAFVKALRRVTPRYVWLNPIPVKQWTNTTAAQLARHIPMFPMDREGMYAAVDALRGRPYFVERPL